ncbi:MAG TPA: hypothetical protein VIM77_10330 [Mucilaginibacter sp.]
MKISTNKKATFLYVETIDEKKIELVKKWAAESGGLKYYSYSNGLKLIIGGSQKNIKKFVEDYNMHPVDVI